MRFALGVAVFSGMLGVTFFGLVFTPIFYDVIRRFTTKTVPAPVHTGEIHPGPPEAHGSSGRPH